MRRARESGIPVNLLAAIVAVESSCRPMAVSKDGARGLMQVVPRFWAREYGHTNLFDPDENLRIGTSILLEMIRLYGPEVGLERYNGKGMRARAYAARVKKIAEE